MKHLKRKLIMAHLPNEKRQKDFFFFFLSTLSETSPHAVQHTPRAQFQYCYSSFYDHQDQGLDLMGKGTGGSACLQYPTLPYSKGRLQ